MKTEKAGCFDSYYIGVISQAHNGPTRVVSTAAVDIEEARRKVSALCSQLTAKDDSWAEGYDPNTAWHVVVVVNVDDIRTVESTRVSMKLVHDNKYGNQSEPQSPSLRVVEYEL